jgi:hypothetical protein
MKIPKKVVICGAEWRIIQTKKKIGGFFRSRDKIIKVNVGSKYIKEILLHEILEAIMANRGLRYDRYGIEMQEDLKFVFSHTEFEQMVRDIAMALKDMLK